MLFRKNFIKDFFILALVINGFFHFFEYAVGVLGLGDIYALLQLNLIIFYTPMLGYFTVSKLLFLILFIYLAFLLYQEKIYPDNPFLELLAFLFFFNGVFHFLQFIVLISGMHGFFMDLGFSMVIELPLLGRIFLIEVLTYLLAAFILLVISSDFYQKIKGRNK